MKKKALSLILALVMCLSLIPITALAGGSDFVIKDGALIKYKGPGGDVVIPSNVNYIGEWAFSFCSDLTSVTILDKGTIPGGFIIGYGAFAGCENLTSVTIPERVVHIMDQAFFGCSNLKDVYYGGSENSWKNISIESKLLHNSQLFLAEIHYNSTGPVQPQQPQQPAGTAAASPTNDKLEVNGAAANPTVYKIGGSNYFKIRDVAALLNGTEKQFAVGYDGALSSVTATTGQGYDKQAGDLAGAATGGDQEAAVSNDAIYVDGQKVEAEVYKINGSNYFKLRDLGRALNFYVGWSAERGMYIETDKPYAE